LGLPPPQKKRGGRGGAGSRGLSSVKRKKKEKKKRRRLAQGVAVPLSGSIEKRCRCLGSRRKGEKGEKKKEGKKRRLRFCSIGRCDRERQKRGRGESSSQLCKKAQGKKEGGNADIIFVYLLSSSQEGGGRGGNALLLLTQRGGGAGGERKKQTSASPPGALEQRKGLLCESRGEEGGKRSICPMTRPEGGKGLPSHFGVGGRREEEPASFSSEKKGGKGEWGGKSFSIRSRTTLQKKKGEEYHTSLACKVRKKKEGGGKYRLNRGKTVEGRVLQRRAVCCSTGKKKGEKLTWPRRRGGKEVIIHRKGGREEKKKECSLIPLPQLLDPEGEERERGGEEKSYPLPTIPAQRKGEGGKGDFLFVKKGRGGRGGEGESRQPFPLERHRGEKKEGTRKGCPRPYRWGK